MEHPEGYQTSRDHFFASKAIVRPVPATDRPFSSDFCLSASSWRQNRHLHLTSEKITHQVDTPKTTFNGLLRAPSPISDILRLFLDKLIFILAEFIITLPKDNDDLPVVTLQLLFLTFCPPPLSSPTLLLLCSRTAARCRHCPYSRL